MPYSAAASGMRSSRRSSLRAWSSTSSGIRPWRSPRELGDLCGLALLAFAELALDRRHLLAQQHLALALVERGLGLLADLLRQAQDLDALREQPRDLVHARRESIVSRISCFSSGLSPCRRRKVGERARRATLCTAATARPAPAAAARAPPASGAAGAGSAPRSRACFVSGSGMRCTRATRNGQPSRNSSDLEALLALADEVVRAIGRGDVAHDVGDRAHAVQVDGQRIGDLAVALHQEPDLPLLAHGVLGSRDRALDARPSPA